MQKITGTVVKSSAIALALALAGCGGGGGGSSTPVGSTPGSTPGATTPAPTAQRTIQGTAAKGLIKGGKISVYALDAQGVRGASALASAVTGTDGTYTLQIPANVQNFVLEVTAASGAVMADEATGTDIAIPDSLKLRTVVTLASNADTKYSANVSPLTEMVARTAETADGKLPTAAVALAKTSVRTLLGFDPETVKPINSNSDAVAGASEDEKNQSLALAAISKMGSAVSADCAQTNPGERIACVVTKLAGSVKVTNGQPSLDQNSLAKFSDAIQSVAKDKTINHTGKDKIVGIPVLATPTPPASTTPAATPVDATKALFGSLRTNLRSLGDSDAFRSTVDGIQADLTGTVAPLANDVGGLVTLVPTMADVLDAFRAGSLGSMTTAVVYDNIAYPWSGYDMPPYDGNGNCTMVASPLSITCTVVQADYLPGSGSVDPSSYKIVYMNRVFKLEPKAGSTTDYSYTTYLQQASVQYNGMSTSHPSAPVQVGDVQTGTISYAASGGTVSQFSFKGGVTGRLADDGTLVSDHEDWALNVSRSQEPSGTYLYKVDGSATAYKGGQAAGKVTIDSSSFVRVAQDSNGKVPQNAANELQLTLSGTLADTTVSGTLHLKDDKQDKSKTTHMPTTLSFDGSLKHKDATVFTGSASLTRGGYENYDATAPVSDTNFIADAVQLSGSLSVPNRPTLSLTVGATRTGKEAVDISAQYGDGTSVINASVSAKAGQANPVVKVSSADGVAFSFSDLVTPVKVTKDGAVVAELNLAKGMITYADGATESIK